MVNSENAIEVRDLVIRYKTLKQVSIKQSLLSFRKSKIKEHEALKGISFDVKKGGILGIVGRNGSGKSTLLKAIAGIFSPDSGNIQLYSNSVSLIAIGKGFDKNLTGRENIRLTGMLLGFSREKIEQEMDRIIRYSELGSFIDMPVKTYSSGMFSKLSFSINTILLTDIVLIDEVLSVGDAEFKKKSKRRMKKIIKSKKRTVVMVTHSMNEIRNECDSVIWLDEGRIVEQGPANDVVDNYLIATGAMTKEEIEARKIAEKEEELLLKQMKKEANIKEMANADISNNGNS